MYKQRSAGEIYNDIDSGVVSVFRVLRDPEKSSRLEELIRLTPFSREEYFDAYKPSDDPIESARRMIFRSFAGFGSDSAFNVRGFRGGFVNKESGCTGAGSWASFPNEIKSFCERLQGVVIENRNAVDLIKRYDRPDTLFYADPPYLKSTRSKANASVKYRFEVNDEYHRELAVALNNIKGMAIVSGYKSAEYKNLYCKWRKKKRIARSHRGIKREEFVWISPNVNLCSFDF